MRNVIRFFAMTAFSVLMLGAMPAIASAQWTIFGGNGGYNQGNTRGRNSRALVVNIKNRSKEFARRLDRELDQSRYNGSWEEDRLNALARDFYQAADDLEDNFGNGRGSYRTDDYMRRVLTMGRGLDRELSRFRLDRDVRSDWARIQRDLRELENTFIAYGGVNRGRGRNDDDNWSRGRGNGRYERNDDSDRKNGYPFPF